MARTAATAATADESAPPASEPASTARTRLADALRPALDARPGFGPADADRLACLLVGHLQYEVVTGRPPPGPLAAIPPPFDGVEVPRAAVAALDDLRGGLEADPPGVTSIGGGYEASLGAATRGANGQFYTPTPIAHALARWALDGVEVGPGGPTVLDPAVGTGTFLLAVLESLRDRDPTRDPAAWLDRLVGVDVDGVGLAIARLRLAAAVGGGFDDDVRLVPPGLHHASFFDCEPVLPGGTSGTTATAERPSLGPVDAVVGNPPYVRAEALGPDVDDYRRHLAAFGPPGETPWLDGPDALSRRSDAYVYFVTHATRFLRPGGRLALVLPTKWLMSDYGRGLRRFLRERYRVHAVVGFDGRAFGDALVDTALLLAVRDESARADRPLRFVRLDGPASLAGLAAESSADARSTTDGRAVVQRTQRSLTAAGSLARFLEVPADVRALFDGPAFVRLDALADVARGTMTGANRFFFVDAATVDRFDLEPDVVRPAVKSLRWVDRPVVGLDDVERWVVDAHDAVAAARGVAGDSVDDPAPAGLVESLSSVGYPGLRAYVEHAQAAGWHEGRTCRSRSVWFDLGPLRTPVAFVPKLLRERVFVVRNAARAVPSNAIDGVWPTDGVDHGALFAVLNASVGRLAMEVTGRDEAGLLQLMTYETASLPTLDVRRCSAADRERLAAAGTRYADEPTVDALAALDDAVDDAYDLPLAGASLREHAAALSRRRVDGGERPAGSG